MIDENFLNILKNKYTESQVQYIEEEFNKIEPSYVNHKIYNINFAYNLARHCVNNNLDYLSIFACLLVPIIMTDENYLHNNEQNLKGEVTKVLYAIIDLQKINISTRQEQLDTVKKMFIALAKDIRVIIIKLCLEREKLKYLDKMSQDEVSELMQSYTDFYSPLASMLGLSHIKNDMENATFKYYKPQMYAELSNALESFVQERNASIQDVIKKIKNEVLPICSNVVVYGRQKQLHSIAKKLQNKNMNLNSIIDVYGRNNNLYENAEKISFSENKLNQIMDILAVRVLVDTVEQCYSVLGKIFTLFKPLGNFKDYISNPKENGYQSLHTAMVLENGDPVEIQIRTFEMHNYAEYGFAAHWAYKEHKNVDLGGQKINYIRSVMELYKDKSPDELLDILSTNVYSGKIFVQSPMGKILEFPEESTPIDFAYAIHSSIGNSCVGAKINNRMVPLNTPMNNGDIIEIITNPNCKGPSRDWIKYVKTTGAKSKINAFFKKEMKEDNIKKGKLILENQAKVKNYNLSKLLTDRYLNVLFDRYSFTCLDDMYASIGYGGITANQVLNKLNVLYKEEIQVEKTPTENKLPSNKSYDNVVSVKGHKDLFIRFANCCRPLPGDNIIGYVSRGNGITVHKTDCPSLKNYEFERLIECSWNDIDRDYVGMITIVANVVANNVAKITKKINDNKINIIGLTAKTINGKDIINIQVSIKKKEDIDDLINKLKNFSFVIDIYRNS